MITVTSNCVAVMVEVGTATFSTDTTDGHMRADRQFEEGIGGVVAAAFKALVEPTSILFLRSTVAVN
ncbi:unnamed protein product [Mesocestoides corti]|uniref:Pantothenate kinase n=1 Tax=Mesocestoides corti TaxID=53468 RepID=A0A0R3U6V1_MESCO|nr:unnamed protein product [Mesocestoides corti]